MTIESSGKHRDNHHTDTPLTRDWESRARCSRGSRPDGEPCYDLYCPRHEAANYTGFAKHVLYFAWVGELKDTIEADRLHRIETTGIEIWGV